MRFMMMIILLFGVAMAATAGDDSGGRGDILVQKVQGDVMVRHGVMEGWAHVAVGDVLRPDDSMKTGKKGSAVLSVQARIGDIIKPKNISLPPEVIVDMSDIRELSQEELMLKLTMERVRASSYQWRNEEMQIPNASVVHGQNQSQAVPPGENDMQTGEFLLNGTHVLFDNGFYSTCALKIMELFRFYPPLRSRFENKLMMGDALAKAHMRSEALTQYSEILQGEGLSPQQQTIVHGRISQLKK
jgi:hypothetical protein